MPPRRDLQQGDDTARQLFGGGLFAPNFLQRAGSAITSATGRIGGVSERDLLPPSQFATPTAPQLGPLIRTSRFDRPATPQSAQPARPAFDYGTYAATRGLPTFDVTKIQTPFSQYSASAPQQLTAGLAQPAPTFPTQLPTRPSVPEAITPNQSTPAAGFARISDWSQNPLVQAARATGDISAIERATVQARNQGRGVFQPNDISSVSLASLKASNPDAGFGRSRTPEQQQELLAQMRQRGADIMAKNLAAQEQFFAQKREERAFQPYSPTPTTIAGIQREFQQFRDLGNSTPTQYAASRGTGGSVYSTTPFAQARGMEALAGFASGTAPSFSQQTLNAMRGGGSQSEERIAGLGLRSPFSNYG